MKMDRRKFLDVSLVSTLSIFLSGCAGFRSDMTIEELLALLRNMREEDEADKTDDEGTGDTGPVIITLTHPAGRSPKVFTSGWVFGARCTRGSEDLSDQVQWSGTASFSPETGAISRPAFGSEGSNTIILTVNVDGKNYRKTFRVDAISPAGFAAVGDLAKVPADSHGCPACPHTCVGPIVSGSPNVFVNGRPAARVGDVGTHAACCDGNSFKISGGNANVIINGRRAAKRGDATTHCGGTGQIIQGAA